MLLYVLMGSVADGRLHLFCLGNHLFKLGYRGDAVAEVLGFVYFHKLGLEVGGYAVAEFFLLSPACVRPAE